MDIKIIRKPNKNETPGQMIVGDFLCCTLELPDLNNLPQKSCIPANTYEWVKVGATHNIPYTHISVLNVHQRSGICIHVGNYASLKKSDVLGCILVGSSFADINKDGIQDIVGSKDAFTKLMEILPDSGNLIIT